MIMSNDFYVAFLSSWVILIIFWSIIIIFVSIRKPPNSKLSRKIVFYSYLIFFALLLLIVIFNYADSFF